MTMRVHVVGGGMAGLATAVALTQGGVTVSVYEAARHAGGRCRSFHDPTLNRTIDNGNHLLLSGNVDTMRYVKAISSEKNLTSPPRAVFPFLDVRTDTRWSVTPNGGFLPWWIFKPDRRIAGTRAWQYLSALRIARARAATTVERALSRPPTLYERFWEPLAVGALNTPADTAAAKLLWPVLRETFLRGRKYCQPLIAREGLSHALVDPAVRLLERSGAPVSTGSRLRRITIEDGLVTQLHLAHGSITVGAADFVVLAAPPWETARLVPHITVPDITCPIVNVHFLLPGPATGFAQSPFIGLVGGVAQWVFVRRDVASVTVSAAHQLASEHVTKIADQTWQDVASALDLHLARPPKYRVIKEKQATFAQTPGQVARRPRTRTDIPNLLLAGSYVDTGLPATIESAVRSGHRAAQHIFATRGIQDYYRTNA